MDITRAYQIALDDALVAPANRLKIGKSNLRLSLDLKSNEPTLQVVYDVLKLTPFYKAFQITVDVLEIYMQEEMLQICPKLPDQQFEEPPFEEEILMFLRDLGHSEEIKVNKNVKRSNEMYYPRFTKVIVNFFMTKDPSIQIRNRVNWYFARDDPMFTMIKVVSRHEDTQLYGAILPNELTNEAIKDSESYKEYYVIASGAEPPKIKASVKKKQAGSDKTKTPSTAKGKRLKTSPKAAKPAKKKQPAKTSKVKGLIVPSEVALTEAEQMKLATKRSLIQTYSSHASGSGADEGTGGKPGVPDVPTYEFDDDKISWKSSDEEDDDNDDDEDNDDDDNDDVDDDADNQDDEGQDDDNEKTDSDNDGDEFVHPKFSTHDQEERQDEEDNEEEGSDLRVQTPSHYESTDDEESDEVTHGANVEGEELDEEETNEEDEANELYRDVNVHLEGRDTEMTDAPRTIVQTTQVIEDTHVIITPVNPEGQQQSYYVSSGFVSNMLNPSPDTCIDYIFNLNTESTSLVDVLEFKQTNQFAVAVSLIPGIVDTYLANKMNETIKTAIQLQSDRLRDEAQADNGDFINKLDDKIKKIIKEQVKAQVSKILPKIKKTVNEQLEAEVLTRSSNETKTSHAVSANLSELQLKKILIDKMESSKSIHISEEQKNLYKALVDAYESDKLILDTYGDTVSFKTHRDDEDKDEEPSTGSNQGSKRRRAGKEPESTSAPKEKTSKTIGKSTEGSNSHHKSA
ncbi:hypothetical protein Tco_0807592 [Tanacetum coccineum]